MPKQTHSTGLPEAFLSIDGLGAPVAYFSSKRTGRTIGLAIAIILFLLGLLSLLLGGVVAWRTAVQEGPAVIFAALKWALIISLALWLGAMAALLYAIARQHFNVVVFAQGLAHFSGKKLRSWPWHEVENFYLSISRLDWFGREAGKSHHFKVEFSDFEKFSFDDHLPQADKLAELIEEKTTPFIYQKTAERFNAGGQADFDTIILTSSEMRIKSASMSWDEITEINLGRGILKITLTNGKRTSVPVRTIPNLKALLNTLQQVSTLVIDEE